MSALSQARTKLFWQLALSLPGKESRDCTICPASRTSRWHSRLISTTILSVEREISVIQSSRKTEWFVWGAILLTVLVIAVAFARSKIEQGETVDLRPINQLPEFTLTNQDGRAVSLADLRGHVWV